MVRISPFVLKSRAEHNEKDLSTLEELSLNSLSIERIEVVQTACRRLQILHLTDNAIGKLENLKLFKDLRYLNIAMNNISLIENLEDLEMLRKADFTLNFIGRLIESVHNLMRIHSLRDLYLVGNPCASFKGYRDFVVGSLDQLDSLDGKVILRDERIMAKQRLPHLLEEIRAEEVVYLEKREEERKFHEETIRSNLEYYTDESIPLLERREKYYKSPCSHSPEYRLEQCRMKEYFDSEDEKQRNPSPSPPKAPRRLINESGDPLNVNEIKWEFKYNDHGDSNVLIEIEIPKYIDTKSVDVSIEPNYIKLVYKNKVLQLRLLDEIITSKSKAERSIATGNLVISMPRLRSISSALKYTTKESDKKGPNQQVDDPLVNDSYLHHRPRKVDYRNICQEEPPPLILEED